MARQLRKGKQARFDVEPAAYTLAYRRVADEGRRQQPLRSLEVQGCDSYATQDVDILVRREGERLSFAVTPHAPVRLESFEVSLAHAFSTGEQVLLNGYQSWTTTSWLPASHGMRGLSTVPPAIVNRYALDAMGDYRFTRYGGPGSQHGFTYGLMRAGRQCALVASLDESRGFTLIRTDETAGTVTLRTECPQRTLAPGETLTIGDYGLFIGAEETLYDRWFALSGIDARPVMPLVGYSSWYRHYGDVDHAKLEADLSGAVTAFAAMGLPVGAAGQEFIPLFQVDDGFCTVGDWQRPDPAKFPDGMGAVAERIRAAGFLPGLWMAPFVCAESSQLHAQHPDWILRDESGAEVRTGSHWGGAVALDTRNAQVRNHVCESVRTAVRDWGFGLLKLDFLYAACMLPHDGLNRGQLMADALALLREAAGESCLLLGCGVPLASAFGVVDYCRIGCDVGLDWDDKPPMRLLHRERVSTKNSLGDTIARAPLDGRAFGNDPDVFFLRDDVKLSARQRQQLLDADARFGSMLLTSDDMGEWGTAKREQYQAALHTLLERKSRG